MNKWLASIVLVLGLAAPSSAQIVGQGQGGFSPWLVSGTFAPPPVVTSLATVLNNPGQTLNFQIDGYTGASAHLALVGFSGAIQFKISIDNGANYGFTHFGSLLGPPRITKTSTLETGFENVWIYIPPGVTHVQVLMATRTAGQVTATIAKNMAQTDPIAIAMGREFFTDIIETSMQIGGAAVPGGEWHAATVTSAAPGDGAQALVVRNRTAVASIGEVASISNDTLGHAIAIRNLTTNGVTDLAARTDAVTAADRGVIARIIPSITLPQLVRLDAGAAIAGKFGIDQTTPGTTNKVAIGNDGIVSTKTALTANAPATNSVGVASALALAANALRKGLVIVNLSVNTVCFGIGAAAVLNSGICLQPGVPWNMNEYTFTTAAINAIASAAASVVSIQELQ